MDAINSFLKCDVGNSLKNAVGGINLLELNRKRLKFETNNFFSLKIIAHKYFYTTLTDL